MLKNLLQNCIHLLAAAGAKSPRRANQKSVQLMFELLEARDTPSLTPISPNAGYPYSSIDKLYITFPDHKTFVGSGAMVDSFHVLTAGHNTYSASDGGWATSIKVVPDMSGTSQPFGYAMMTYERTYNTFVNYANAHPGSTTSGDYDIGLLTLDRNIGNQTSWMSYGYDNNDARFAAGHILNTAGYPAAGGYDGSKMYFSSGAIAGLSSDKQAIDYYQSNITTYGGQSGSPVWEYNSSTGARTIFGVHVAGSGTANSLNFATRITSGIFADLQRWRSQDVAPKQSAVGQSAFAGTVSLTGANLTQHIQSAEDAGMGADDVGAAAIPNGGPADTGAIPTDVTDLTVTIDPGTAWSTLAGATLGATPTTALTGPTTPLASPLVPALGTGIAQPVPTGITLMGTGLDLGIAHLGGIGVTPAGLNLGTMPGCTESTFTPSVTSPANSIEAAVTSLDLGHRVTTDDAHASIDQAFLAINDSACQTDADDPTNLSPELATALFEQGW